MPIMPCSFFPMLVMAMPPSSGAIGAAAHRPMNIVAIRTAFADAWAFATRPLSTLLVGTRKI